MQVSVSDLRKYLFCPRKYWLSEIQGIDSDTIKLSLCRSIAVKQIISLIHENQNKKPHDYSKDEINRTCESVWNSIIDDERVDKGELDSIVVTAKKATKNKPEKLAITKKERVLHNIQNWVFEYSREEVDVEVLYTNTYFQTQIGHTTFVGYIDLIRKVNGTLQIIVFNSSPSAPDSAYIQHDFILSLYAHAIWQGSIFPMYPDLNNNVKCKTVPELYIYYLPRLERYQKKTGKSKKGDRKGNPLINATRTREELFEFEYELLYAISGIQNNFFPKMPSNPCGCSLCPYQEACMKHSIFERKEDTSFNVEEFEQMEVTI